MARLHSRRFQIAAPLLILVVACAAPGLITPQPPPVVGPQELSTMIAGTAASLGTQTGIAQLLSALPASQPVEETASATATATPEISAEGTALIELADGSTRFLDEIVGIQLLVPAGWLNLRPNEAEYFKAWESQWAGDPAFVSELTLMQQSDPKAFRLFALDVRPDHIVHGEITNMNVVFQIDDPRTLEEVAADQTRPDPFPDYKLISSGFQQTSAGLRAFVTERQWSALSGTNESYTLFYKRVIFKLPAGVAALDLLTPLDFKEVVLPDFDQFVNSMVVTQ